MIGILPPLSKSNVFFTFIIFSFFQASFAQCTDNSIRPSDTYSVETLSPRCQNGNDAEIRVFNIATTSGNTLINQNYAIRIISGPNAPMQYPIPTGLTDYTITGLQAGNYVIDIIDACGGNSADKSVVITNPIPNIATTIELKDKKTDLINQNCGSILMFKISMVASGTGGDTTYEFTNNLGEILSFTRSIPRKSSAGYFAYTLDAEIPEAFFNGSIINYTCTNLCGIVGQGTLQKPTLHSMIWGQPNMIDAQDPNNLCNIGYDVKIFRNYMTNPITVTVEETNNPGNTPLNFYGQVINSQTVDLVHLNSAPIGMATVISLGLKYDTNYTLYFTDACGLTATETISKELVDFNPTLICDPNLYNTDSNGYFDDASLIKFNALPLSSQSLGPLQVTVNSGPTYYTTNSGNNNTVITSAITYPYNFEIDTPYQTINVTKDNVKSFPPGNYNFTITDECNKTYTFDQQITCIRNNDISHQLNTCGNVNNLVNVIIKVPVSITYSRATLYKADGTIIITGLMDNGSPFNLFSSTGGHFRNISVDLPNNESYIFRYGGVKSNGTLSEPTQFGGNGTLPRLTDGYLYEYAFDVAVAPFQFDSIIACDSDVQMSVTGGTSPYNFTLLDSSGNTQLFPNQSAANFTDLQPGTTYVAKVIDSCGREFSQEFTTLISPNPEINSILNPECNSEFGNITITNLPNNWTLIDSQNNIEIHGNTNTYTIENLPVGTYNLTCIDVDTQCLNSNNLTFEIIETNTCPITTDDIVTFNAGQIIEINVLENDTTGALIDSTSVRILDNQNFSGVNYDNNNEIISASILNEGTWSVDLNNGKISYEPFNNTSIVPTSIQYYGKDFDGNISNNSLIILDLLPIAVDDNFSFINDSINTYNVIHNDTLGDLINPTTVSFVIPNNLNGINYTTNASLSINQLIIPNEGIWLISPITGEIIFQPEPNFTGNPTEKFYTVKDNQNNTSNVAKITFDNLCQTNIICPTETTIYVNCFSEVPNVSNFNITNFEALGGQIVNSCGTIIVSATSSTYNGCNSEVYLTISIIDLVDTNNDETNNNNNNNQESIECVITYKINDTIPPVFNETLPENKIISCNQIEEPVILTATDNCGSATVSVVESVENGTCEYNYSITRTWIATDECGNSTNHTQTITIQDTEAPELVTNIPSIIEISSHENIPSISELTFVDNCGNVTVNFNEEIIDGDCKNSYEIHRTWTATDSCGNENYFLQIISIRDTTPPQFMTEIPLNITADCDNIPEIPIVIAFDGTTEVEVDYTEEKIEGDCNSRFEIRRTWTATDSCGNSTTQTQIINLTCHINIYNALSLNDDGKNDTFLLDGIECFPNNTVEIYNRWGAKVFETTAYDNNQNVFKGISGGKGTLSRNEKLPTGTYFYIINYEYNIEKTNKIENIQKTGYLYIVNN